MKLIKITAATAAAVPATAAVGATGAGAAATAPIFHKRIRLLVVLWGAYRHISSCNDGCFYLCVFVFWPPVTNKSAGVN